MARRTAAILACVLLVVACGCLTPGDGGTTTTSTATTTTNTGTTTTATTTSTTTTTTTTSAEPPPASIAVENVTVARGGYAGNATLVVRVENVAELWFSGFPRVEGLDVETSVGAIDFSPEPRGQVDTYPPYWVWDRVQPTVVARIPVRAGENATLGEHTYQLSALNRTDHRHELAVTARVTITVVEPADAGGEKRVRSATLDDPTERDRQVADPFGEKALRDVSEFRLKAPFRSRPLGNHTGSTRGGSPAERSGAPLLPPEDASRAFPTACSRDCSHAGRRSCSLVDSLCGL